MCGRYASTRSSADLATLFDAVDGTGELTRPSFNLAPTQNIPIVRLSRTVDGRIVSAARWGLVPPWSKDPSIGVRMINARAETVATSRAFRSPFSRKRCLVPADGWYEWHKLPQGGKQPYFMTNPDGSPVVFAGLWETWGKDEDRLMTCTVLTTAAVGEFSEVHDRMPLLLGPDRYSTWLGEADDPADLLSGPDEGVMSGLEIRPVGRAVGNVKNDSPLLVERVQLEPAGSSSSTRATATGDGQATLF